ncbi:pre-mRNA-splicing factor SPF27 [Sitodiplosis mosellana]|uniref:pre-mRNA-splicing factor SPF27 n=1 Tax=Sitodiplosis mosellana TaxID=263140 RepID=UPI0024442BF1|nr:pre-mRNA-splicing factor SPF27 [Sitodiplosis mosellana]
MSTDVVVDALPYFDQGYEDPGVRETALAMVEEETRRYRPTKNYLEHLPPINTAIFETELMRNEFERIQNRLPMEPLSMKRYELPPPPPSKISELSAWQDAVENSMAQLEHQAVRAMNLELMLEYGCETWKVYLDVLTSMLAKAQKQLEGIKKDIQDINWQRKDKQTAAGEKLRALETQWVMLVSKNYEIEQACVRLEQEIEERKKEEESQQYNEQSPDGNADDGNDADNANDANEANQDEEEEQPNTNGVENGYMEHQNESNEMETD